MRRHAHDARRLRALRTDALQSQARELKKHIDSIRTDYKKMMKSKDTAEVRTALNPSPHLPASNTAAFSTGPARCDHLPGGQACASRWRREG